MIQPVVFEFRIDGDTWRVGFMDEPEVPDDPTVAFYKNEEQVARAVVHLSEKATCVDPDHIVAVFVGE